MNGQTTGKITRQIYRRCVMEGDPTLVEDDVPPECRYEETITVGEMRGRRVGIIRRICCNGLPFSFDGHLNEPHISHRRYI